MPCCGLIPAIRIKTLPDVALFEVEYAGESCDSFRRRPQRRVLARAGLIENAGDIAAFSEQLSFLAAVHNSFPFAWGCPVVGLEFTSRY